LDGGDVRQKKRKTGDNDNEGPPGITVKYRRVLRNIPMDIPFMPIQMESGRRVYLRILSNEKRLGGSEGNHDIELKDIADGAELLNFKEQPIANNNKNRTLIPDWESVKAESRLLVRYK